MKYISTRNADERVSFSEAILKGISSDGGLFVPEEFPKLTDDELQSMAEMCYSERANLVLSKYMTDFTKEEIADCTEKAYSRFEVNENGEKDPCPVVKIDDGIFVMELFHGPTLAFKDMALTLFPHILSKARKNVGMNEEVLILVATSGDTGKAALEGFRDVEGTKVLVFYPHNGVSDMQYLQMSTQLGDNVGVAAIKGNFDNCQTGVKEIFVDEDFENQLKEKGYKFSSANSINLGRLLPQVVYYFSTYIDLVSSEEIEFGDKINFAVPTGNFGDILAGYYAKQMGLPINKLICASNTNKVLTDFFETGKYDANRDFFKTVSPSMDILVSSNLERLLFLASKNNSQKINDWMTSLKNTGEFTVDEDVMNYFRDDFFAGYATEEDTLKTIGLFNDEYGYVVDPHTAVAVYVEDEYCISEGDFSPMVIVSTASPYKFSSDVLSAIHVKPTDSPFNNASKLRRETAIEIPKAISDLEYLDIRFNDVYEINNMREAVIDFVNGNNGEEE